MRMDQPRRRLSPPLALALLVLLAGPLALAVVPRLLRPPALHGLELQGSKPAADIALTAAGGRTVRLSDLKGKLVVLYFGYTFCPDVCPMTLAKLAQARSLIGAPAADVQVVMVTVDPERDTPELLHRYVTNFDPTFLGLTGTPDDIAAAATALGIYYRKHEGSAATGYLVDHTATTLVLDRQGIPRLIFPPDQESPEIAADLRVLLGR